MISPIDSSRCGREYILDENHRVLDLIPDTIDLATDNMVLHHMHNGADILLLRTPNNKLCFLQIIVKIGSLDERKSELEIAHLLEHLNGRFTSRKYPDGRLNMKMVNDYGGSMNASVTDYLSEFQISGPALYTSLFWDLLFQSYIDYIPDSDPKTLTNEKTAVEEELNELLSDPWIDLEQTIYSTLWPNTRVATTIQERLANLPYITEKILTKFRNRNYIPQNTIFIVAGDISQDIINNVITNIISQSKSSIDNSWICHRLIENPLPSLCKRKVVNNDILFVPNKKATSYRLDIIFKTCIPTFSRKEHSSEWLSDLLTGGMSGLLFNECRTVRGLIYHISSNLFADNINPNYSYFEISTTVVKERLYEVIKAIFDVLSDIKLDDNNLIECNIPRLKNQFITTMLNHVIHQSPESYALQYSSEIPWGGCIKTFRKAIEDAQALLTVENIRNTVRDVCNYDHLLVAYSGPTNLNKDIRKILKKIKMQNRKSRNRSRRKVQFEPDTNRLKVTVTQQ